MQHVIEVPTVPCVPFLQSFIYQGLQFLEAIHSRGIIHCDIKFDNILLSCGQLKGTDLGQAASVGITHEAG